MRDPHRYNAEGRSKTAAMEKKKKSVKDRIVSAAWELFYEKGYDSTTVDDIIRLSDTSKGSFYYYFDGKDALLNTLSSVLDDLYLTLKEEMDPYMDSFEKLMFLNYRSHTFMEKTIKVDLLASLYSTQLISKGERSLLDQNREYYKLIASVIEEGQKRGEINRRKSIPSGIGPLAWLPLWCWQQAFSADTNIRASLRWTLR